LLQPLKALPGGLMISDFACKAPVVPPPEVKKIRKNEIGSDAGDIILYFGYSRKAGKEINVYQLNKQILDVPEYITNVCEGILQWGVEMQENRDVHFAET
jgi:hypothetical protein